MKDNESSYTRYSGIDVGKFSLDLAFYGDNTTYKYDNSKTGWRKLWKEHSKKLHQSLVVVETTGWYELGVLKYLTGKQVAVHRASARKVKQFIASYGTLAKSDSIDATHLARYAKERHEYLDKYEIQESITRELQLLYSRNLDLKAMLVQEKNRLQAPENSEIKCHINPIIKTIEQEIVKVIERINNIIASDDLLQKKLNVLLTIDGVGELTAIGLLASLPELGTVNRKKIASLAGLAPHPNDSGQKNGYRKTRGGRKIIRVIVHMASLGAIRKEGSKLREFYLRLTEVNKKSAMAAITAVKRKIIVIANARLAEIL